MITLPGPQAMELSPTNTHDEDEVTDTGGATSLHGADDVCGDDDYVEDSKDEDGDDEYVVGQGTEDC
jgi:hypothetical protein